MGLLRSCVQLCDRPGLRPVLVGLTNGYARWRVGAGVGIQFDEVWAHRVGDVVYPDAQRFNYFAADIEWWPSQPAHDRQLTFDYWFHGYEPRPGDTILDIGAGKGEDIITFAELVGSSGRVVAVEAHPATFETLRHLCRLNALTNTTCLNVAVVDRPQVVQITSGEDWQSNSLTRDQASADAVSIRGTTIEDICVSRDIKRVDLLKMNIEGAERYAIDGMTNVIDRIRTVCIACHDFRADRGESDNFRTRTRVVEYLQDHGFSVRLRSADPRDWVRDHVHARREPLD